jgi:hypothetical protein
MLRGRSYSWNSDQSDGPVIIEREPDVRTTRPAQQRKQLKRLTFGLKFVNPFKSRKPSVRIVRQEVHRRQRRTDRPEVDETRGRDRDPRRSEDSASMSRGRGQGDFVPLPPPIPPHDPGPINEAVPLPQERRPQVHQLRRNSFDLPMNRSPVRGFEDWRRDADRQVRREVRRRREAEENAAQGRRAAARERELRRRQVDDLAQRMNRIAIHERETRREAEEEARRLEARARQAEYALARERELAERERVVQERLRQEEMRELAEAEALARRPRPVHIVQGDLPLAMDRGAEILRQAQEVERRRREDDWWFYRMERDAYRDLPRRRRSITIYEDDDDRWRPRRL